MAADGARTVTAAESGLSEAEAARRLAERGPIEPPASSRSYASIIIANVFTVFNLILAVFGALTLAFAAWQDALFLGVLVGNTLIGVTQEVRAKKALDRLSALVAPTATVVRDGKPRKVAPEELVVGDLVQLQPGDQLVADGRLETSQGLMLDESILTGESRLVAKEPGEELHSGAFAVEGNGHFTITAVGADSYAGRITGEARRFRHPRSPLERVMNRLLWSLVAVMVPLGSVLGYALWERNEPISEAVTTAVAAVVSMVPEGLILLVSLTFAVAAIRMARKGALVQQLNAIESLASVDVVCLDKTGTLTEPRLRVVELIPAAELDEAAFAETLTRLAASATTRNATTTAIAEDYPGEGERAEAEVPFSSRRRWSGLRLDGVSYVLGAPELFSLGPLSGRAEEEARTGRRVLALGRSEKPFGEIEPESKPPKKLHTLGLVVLGERLRANARETVAFFLSQGVTLKIISGDRPATVGAIAADVGIPVMGPPADGGALPDDPAALSELLRKTNVVGRISPEGKKRVIEALSADGHYVAMVGDGVNDVPGLKAARLAIAQGSGVQMARSVADIVLVQSDFATVPQLVAEGRRILRNLQRVAKLFVSKSAFAAFLILSIGITPTAYPLLPRHLTLGASLAVGIPSFFLALAPSAGAFQLKGFLRDVFNFAIPAGTAVGLGVLSSYLVALEVANLPLIEARTVATAVMIVVGLYLIIALEATGRLRGTAVGMICLTLLAAFVTVLLVPFPREFFALAAPNFMIGLIAAAGATIAICGLVLTDDRFIPGRGQLSAATES